MKLGIEPDLAVYAKAMSNGFPFGVVVGRADVMDAANASFISSSYWTDAVGTSAARACLEKIEREHVSDSLWETGNQFQADLRTVAASPPGCHLTAGGMPPSPSLSFGTGPEATSAKVLMVRGLVGRGFLASSQLYLMQAHQVGQRASFVSALDETLGRIEEEIARGPLLNSAGRMDTTNTFARLA